MAGNKVILEIQLPIDIASFEELSQYTNEIEDDLRKEGVQTSSSVGRSSSQFSSSYLVRLRITIPDYGLTPIQLYNKRETLVKYVKCQFKGKASSINETII